MVRARGPADRRRRRDALLGDLLLLHMAQRAQRGGQDRHRAGPLRRLRRRAVRGRRRGARLRGAPHRRAGRALRVVLVADGHRATGIARGHGAHGRHRAPRRGVGGELDRQLGGRRRQEVGTGQRRQAPVHTRRRRARVGRSHLPARPGDGNDGAMLSFRSWPGFPRRGRVLHLEAILVNNLLKVQSFLDLCL